MAQLKQEAAAIERDAASGSAPSPRDASSGRAAAGAAAAAAAALLAASASAPVLSVARRPPSFDTRASYAQRRRPARTLRGIGHALGASGKVIDAAASRRPMSASLPYVRRDPTKAFLDPTERRKQQQQQQAQAQAQAQQRSGASLSHSRSFQQLRRPSCRRRRCRPPCATTTPARRLRRCRRPAPPPMAC